MRYCNLKFVDSKAGVNSTALNKPTAWRTHKLNSCGCYLYILLFHENAVKVTFQFAKKNYENWGPEILTF